MKFLITIKMRKNPIHDPHNKVTGDCPIRPWGMDDSKKICTDATGEHHTILVECEDLDAARAKFELFYHVTRIEEV